MIPPLLPSLPASPPLIPNLPLMKILFILLCCVVVSTASADEEPAIVSKPSRYPVAETLDRLENILKGKGLVIFARVDHGGEAQKVGLKLRPTQLLIFGNPKTGTGLMDAVPLMALDLPLKALAWQDAAGKVWLSYVRPAELQRRHGLNDEQTKVLAGPEALIQQALE